MKKLTAMFCSAVMTISSLAAPTVSAVAMPMPSVKFEVPTTKAQEVQYRRFYRGGPRFYRRGLGGPRFYRRGFYRPYRGYRRGIWVPGAFIAGAIIGGAIAGPRYRVYSPYRRYAYPYPCNSWHQDCWGR